MAWLAAWRNGGVAWLNKYVQRRGGRMAVAAFNGWWHGGISVSINGVAGWQLWRSAAVPAAGVNGVAKWRGVIFVASIWRIVAYGGVAKYQ